jgi:hypothetical protein
MVKFNFEDCYAVEILLLLILSNIFCAGFEVPTAVVMNVAIFWNVVPYVN